MAASYAGTVHFSSSDAQAGLPADYTFTAGQGAHNFIIVLKTAGTQSLAVTDTANPVFTSAQSGVAVVPGAPAVWAVTSLPAGATAGAARTFTITAMDAFGNVASNYFGTVQFSSSDVQAILPADYAFTAADAGSHAFTAALKTAGAQSLTVTDTVNTAFTTTQSITVAPATAASFVISGFPATTAGVAHDFTVTVKDAFGNVATSYTGAVTFSSSDLLAAPPVNYTFTAAHAGIHTFTAVLKKAGARSITVADTAVAALAGAESGIVVSPAAVSQFVISGSVRVTKGVGFKITVTAEDAFGKVNTGYRGTVHLASTDPTGGTQNFTFSSNDNGVHIFSYTFNALSFQPQPPIGRQRSSRSEPRSNCWPTCAECQILHRKTSSLKLRDARRRIYHLLRDTGGRRQKNVAWGVEQDVQR